jgi:hypothetical protein
MIAIIEQYTKFKPLAGDVLKAFQTGKILGIQVRVKKMGATRSMSKMPMTPDICE